MKAPQAKIKTYYLHVKEDKKMLQNIIGPELILELLRFEVVYAVLNHVSNGLMVCDLQRKMDCGRGYLAAADFPYNTRDMLWSMVTMRAISAIEMKATFNEIPKGHKFEMLKFYSNYLSTERDL